MEGSQPREAHIPEPPSLLSSHGLFFLDWDLQTLSHLGLLWWQVSNRLGRLLSIVQFLKSESQWLIEKKHSKSCVLSPLYCSVCPRSQACLQHTWLVAKCWMHTEEEVLPDPCRNVRTTSGLLLSIFPPPSLCLLKLYPPQSATQEHFLPEALTDTTSYHSFLWLPFAGKPGARFPGNRDQLPWEKQNPGRLWR